MVNITYNWELANKHTTNPYDRLNIFNKTVIYQEPWHGQASRDQKIG